MSTAPLTAQLPTVAGALPDLFRRNDPSSLRDEDAKLSPSNDRATFNARSDEQRALTAGSPDDTDRMLARRAALGPLTYGRRMAPAGAPPVAPIGMRGAHLDVRG